MQTALRTTRFQESMIREMTRLALQSGAINLSQGYPDFDPPPEVLEAAAVALRAGVNQYTVTWGYPPLRGRLAELYTSLLGWEVHPDEHVTITCGVSEAICASLLAVLNPGDEVIVIEPAHENFRPAALFAGAEPVAVPLDRPAYHLDADRLRAAVTPRTRALILNTPHNPTGRVFAGEELAAVIDVVTRHDLVLITDEIYDHILYDGRRHVSPGSLEALCDRTITIGGLGKTYAVTGWRLGYAIASEPLAASVRAVHDFLTICAPTPLQAAAVTALNLPASYYAETLADYHQRRDLMLASLSDLGFRAAPPEGAYYVMAAYGDLPLPQAKWDALTFARWLTTEVGVAVVPGGHFYGDHRLGEGVVRFAFCKRLATLQEAAERMREGFLRAGA